MSALIVSYHFLGTELLNLPGSTQRVLRLRRGDTNLTSQCVVVIYQRLVFENPLGLILPPKGTTLHAERGSLS